MEMCYAGAIAMPSSYVVMNEEEMTYTEGGGIWGWLKDTFNPRKTSNLSKYIDIAIIAVSGGIAAWNVYQLKNFLATNRELAIKTVQKELFAMIGGVSGGLCSAALDIALTITGTSIGDIIATALDIADGNRNGLVGK